MCEICKKVRPNDLVLLTYKGYKTKKILLIVKSINDNNKICNHNEIIKKEKKCIIYDTNQKYPEKYGTIHLPFYSFNDITIIKRNATTKDWTEYAVLYGVI